LFFPTAAYTVHVHAGVRQVINRGNLVGSTGQIQTIAEERTIARMPGFDHA